MEKNVFQIYDISENGRHSLVWGSQPHQPVLIDGIKEENAVLEVKEAVFEVKDKSD